MPNINGQYNFNELCLEARASAPWIKKVQRILKLGEGEGNKGARTYYSGEQVHVYAAVKNLRSIGLEFDEIKYIYGIEKKLKSLPNSSVIDITEAKKRQTVGIALNLIISLPPQYGLFLDNSLLASDKSDEIKKLYNKLNEMIIYVRSKAEEVKNTAAQLEANLLAFQKENDLSSFKIYNLV